MTVFHLRVFLLLGDVLVSLGLVKIAIDVELLGGRITRHRHAGRDRLDTSLLLRVFGRQGWLVCRSDFSPLVESVRFQLMVSVLLDDGDISLKGRCIDILHLQILLGVKIPVRAIHAAEG